MIARAAEVVRPAAPTSPSLVGSRRPQPHRFHLSDGRVLEGHLHRTPNARLADHLANLKGYISVTEAHCVATAERFPYLVLNADHVLMIEEVAVEAPAGAVLPSQSYLARAS